MTAPDYSAITDTSRPRPVRISAYIGSVATVLLGVLTATEVLNQVVAGSLVGAVALISLGGWLFVEQKVTPVASPAATLPDGTLTRLKPAPGPALQQDPPDGGPGGLGIA